MKGERDSSGLDPELEAFLTPRKIEREMPFELRARVLTRARATLAGEAIPPVQPPQARPMPIARRRRLFRFAAAASIAIAGAAVGAVAVLHGRDRLSPQVSPDRSATLNAPVTRDTSPSSEAPLPALEHDAARPSHVARPGTKGDPFAAELELLQRAHAAYTRHDFTAALTVVAEHARRFPRGHLAEQREALRVRSLQGAGRTDEAHRAAAAFAVRFPRSVLLPRVAEGSESSER
ncbi:MAG TPA: hypothetical protein VN903_12650 [Polyangia bacterium]|nr:hypothetical protein [Polyangia bacterium]